jgi:hypothetical protein
MRDNQNRIDVLRALVPPLDKTSSEWTPNEWQAMVLLKRTIIRHFADDFWDRDEDDDDDITLADALDVCSKATREGRVLDAFYDELAQLADQARGGTIQ